MRGGQWRGMYRIASIGSFEAFRPLVPALQTIGTWICGPTSIHGSHDWQSCSKSSGSEPILRAMRQRSRFDSAGFFVGFGGAVIVVGGIVVATAKPDATFFSVPWNTVGVGVVLLGVALLLWSLVLFLVDQRVAEHWCPDPAAHDLPGNATPEDWRQLRSVLHQIRNDVQAAISRLDQAIQTGRYWSISAYVLEDWAWKKNRRQLAGVGGMTQLLDALRPAFKHVDRIKGFVLLRAFQGGHVRPGDELEAALAALELAQAQLDARLAAIDAPSPTAATEMNASRQEALTSETPKPVLPSGHRLQRHHFGPSDPWSRWTARAAGMESEGNGNPTSRLLRDEPYALSTLRRDPIRRGARDRTRSSGK
jgi:hypothetical protein